jgi:PAS domain S-box-containing protein
LAIRSFIKALDMTFRWKMRWGSRESTAKAGGSRAASWPGLSVAIAAPLAVTALKLAWPDPLGYSGPFLLYFAATLIGAWSGGLLGGVVTVALSTVLGMYLFVEPYGRLAFSQPEGWLTPAIFVVEGLAISWLTARLQGTRARAVKQAEEAQLLVAKLESVLASVDDGITVQDPHGKLIYANEPAAKLTGYPSAAALLAAPLLEVMGRFDLRAPDGSRFPMAELPGRKVLQGQPAPEQLMRVRVLASGEERWSLVRAAPVKLPGGEVQYAVNVFHDLTALRERDEALRVGQAWFATALNSIGDAVIATDPKGAVTFLNPTAERLTGWTSAEAMGRPLAEVFQIVDETTRVQVENPLERVLREGHVAGLANRSMLLSRHGGEIAIDDSAAPIRSADGPLAGAVLVFRDVTQRRAEEREVARAREEAEYASRAKDEFLAMLGHELRNPLAPIVTALQLIKDDGAQPYQNEVGVIERQVRHMVRLVDDLLDVSRITGGKVQLFKQRSALSAVIARAIELAGPLLSERQQELNVSVPGDLYVECDVERLAQAFTNLLNNAAKYTAPRGRIDISASASEDELMLRVRDDGVGIEPELLPRVFELFVQGQQALDRARGGLGLGLAIVRSLIELHGGQVSAHSEGTGKGSEFRIYLPLAVTHRADNAAAQAEPPRSRASERPARLLVVDDNSDALQLLSRALRRLGHEVHEAEDAVGALAVAAMVEADVALLDIGLPLIDGYELAAHLRAVPGWQAVKLVALTGYGQLSDKERAHAAGFDEHLIKPVSLEALSCVLNRLTAPAAV